MRKIMGIGRNICIRPKLIAIISSTYYVIFVCHQHLLIYNEENGDDETLVFVLKLLTMQTSLFYLQQCVLCHPWNVRAIMMMDVLQQIRVISYALPTGWKHCFPRNLIGEHNNQGLQKITVSCVIQQNTIIPCYHWFPNGNFTPGTCDR